MTNRVKKFLAVGMSAGLVGWPPLVGGRNAQGTTKPLASEDKAEEGVSPAVVGELHRRVGELAATIDARLPGQEETERIVKAVGQLAGDYSLRCDGVRALKSEMVGGCVQQPVEVRVAGDFGGFYSFLLQVEKLPYPMGAVGMKLRRGQNDGDVAGTVRFNVYMRPAGQATAGGEVPAPVVGPGKPMWAAVRELKERQLVLARQAAAIAGARESRLHSSVLAAAVGALPGGVSLVELSMEIVDTPLDGGDTSQGAGRTSNVEHRTSNVQRVNAGKGPSLPLAPGGVPGERPTSKGGEGSAGGGAVRGRREIALRFTGVAGDEKQLEEMAQRLSAGKSWRDLNVTLVSDPAAEHQFEVRAKTSAAREGAGGEDSGGKYASGAGNDRSQS